MDDILLAARLSVLVDLLQLLALVVEVLDKKKKKNKTIIENCTMSQMFS